MFVYVLKMAMFFKEVSSHQEDHLFDLVLQKQ